MDTDQPEPAPKAGEPEPATPEPTSGATDHADEALDREPAPAFPSGAGTRGALVDRAETLHELGLKRGDDACLAEAVRMIDEALAASPRDADLLHRQARMGTTLALRREDTETLEEALETFEHAFQQHGGRVDPTTHQPGPVFFFDWGRASYELARRREEGELFEAAYERLETGYEMTPRGARHRVAAALMARCRFGRAEAADDEEAYEQVIDRYEQLEDQAPFALEAEDYALWARALSAMAELRDEEALNRRAFERMEQAYERA